MNPISSASLQKKRSCASRPWSANWVGTTKKITKSLPKKVGRPITEQIFFSEQRLAELRKKDSSIPAGKRFAGVCSDFALITAAMLREAGFAAGILEGVQLQGKEAKLDDLHSCAFVPWPGKPGEFLLIPVDGTPSSNPDSTPEDKSSQDTTVEPVPSSDESDLAENNEDTQTDREDNSKEQEHLKSEDPAGFLIESESRRSHLRILRRVLEATWYSGMGRLRKKLDEKELADFFKREIEQERVSLAPEDAEISADADTNIYAAPTKKSKAVGSIKDNSGLDIPILACSGDFFLKQVPLAPNFKTQKQGWLHVSASCFTPFTNCN